MLLGGCLAARCFYVFYKQNIFLFKIRIWIFFTVAVKYILSDIKGAWNKQYTLKLSNIVS